MPNSSSLVLFVLCQVSQKHHLVFLSICVQRLQQLHPVPFKCVSLSTMLRFAWWYLVKCATVTVCVSLVIHDTYTFSTHAAGRIPGKHFNFDFLNVSSLVSLSICCIQSVPNCTLQSFPAFSLLPQFQDKNAVSLSTSCTASLTVLS